MAKTRKSDPPTTATDRRTPIREQRHERRAEIRARWNRRSVNRMFAANQSDDPAAWVTVAGILHFGKWAPHDDLLEYVNPEQFKAIILNLCRIIELKEMPYDEYLQTEEWQTKAAGAKAHYKNQCALNAEHKADDAHHRTYVRRGREYTSDLIPLCRDCHSKFHGKR